MLAITDRAVTAAQRALTDAEEPAVGIRITAESAGCHGARYSLELEDCAGEGDQVIEFGGLKVFVEASILSGLEGVSLDFVADGDDAGFVFNNPNKRRGGGGGGCGCGGNGH